MDRYTAILVFAFVISFFAALWVLYWLPINITTSIGSQSIPTLINGITSSISIVVGFSGVIIGIMFRETDNYPEAKKLYTILIFALSIPLAFLYTTYALLAMSLKASDMAGAVKFGLFSLIIALFLFLCVALSTVKFIESKTYSKTERINQN